MKKLLIALVLCAGCTSTAKSPILLEAKPSTAKSPILEAKIEKLEAKIQKLIEAAIIQNDFSSLFDKRIRRLEFKDEPVRTQVFPPTLKELAQKVLDQLNNDYGPRPKQPKKWVGR